MSAQRNLWSACTLACALWLATSGCSLLLHSEAKQCTKDSDCTSRGRGFEAHVCSSGTCVPDTTIKDDGGPMVGCMVNADCTPASVDHTEVICEQSSHSCLQLTTDACPFVLGDLTRENPMVLGAFAAISTGGVQSQPSTLNYALAVAEFGSNGGIPIGSAGTLRTPLAVICNASAAALDDGLTQLVDNLHVPGLIATFDSKTLRTEFSDKLKASHTFTISPFGADSTLTSLDDNGLLWTMLPSPSDLAPAYQAMFGRVEPYVRKQFSLGTNAMRVATLSGDATVQSDLFESVIAKISWNGKSVSDQDPGNYLNITLPSTLSGNQLSNIDIDPAVQQLIAFKPHVIVVFSSSEFVKLVQVLELQWPAAAGPLPFYLLGPYNVGSASLLTYVGQPNAQGESLRSRSMGVNFASAANDRVLQAYERRFLGRFPTAMDSLGQENYYDSMYYLIYSVVGAGLVPALTGDNLVEGMYRLVSKTAPPYDMGPQAMGDVFAALRPAVGSVGLVGTLGDPNFNLGFGARRGEGSAYCIERPASADAAYVYDTLRIAASTDLDSAGDPKSPMLVGTTPCITGF